MFVNNSTSDEIISAFNAALNFSLDVLPSDEAVRFLSLWREGCWDEIEIEYPDFNLKTAEVCGYSCVKS